MKSGKVPSYRREAVGGNRNRPAGGRHQQNLVPPLDDQQTQAYSKGFGNGFRPWHQIHRPGKVCAAQGTDRTDRAAGIGGAADQSPQLHHRLVPVTRAIFIHQPGRHLVKMSRFEVGQGPGGRQ